MPVSQSSPQSGSQSPSKATKINYKNYPDESGHFGPYGGKFVPETLMPALEELEEVYLKSKHDKEFQAELAHLFRTFVGRPTPVTYARRLTEHFGGPLRHVLEDFFAQGFRCAFHGHDQ